MQKLEPQPIAEDMVNYFRLHTELVLSAEALLLAREQGINVSVGPETREKLKQMRRLEKHIGKSGLHTMSPHLQFTARDMWEIHLLEADALAHH